MNIGMFCDDGQKGVSWWEKKLRMGKRRQGQKSEGRLPDGTGLGGTPSGVLTVLKGFSARL